MKDDVPVAEVTTHVRSRQDKFKETTPEKIRIQTKETNTSNTWKASLPTERRYLLLKD